jgi:hypothetical protein
MIRSLWRLYASAILAIITIHLNVSNRIAHVVLKYVRRWVETRMVPGS